MLGQQPVQHHRDLVGGAVRLGGDPPVLDQLLAVEETEHGVGVADVDREQHHAPPRVTATLSMSRVLPTRAATASSAGPVVPSGTSVSAPVSTSAR